MLLRFLPGEADDGADEFFGLRLGIKKEDKPSREVFVRNESACSPAAMNGPDEASLSEIRCWTPARTFGMDDPDLLSTAGVRTL